MIENTERSRPAVSCVSICSPPQSKQPKSNSDSNPQPSPPSNNKENFQLAAKKKISSRLEKLAQPKNVLSKPPLAPSDNRKPRMKSANAPIKIAAKTASNKNDEITSLKKLLAEQSAESEQLKADLRSKDETIGSLKNQLSRQEELIGSLEQKMENSDSKMDQLMEQMKQLTTNKQPEVPVAKDKRERRREFTPIPEESELESSPRELDPEDLEELDMQMEPTSRAMNKDMESFWRWLSQEQPPSLCREERGATSMKDQMSLLIREAKRNPNVRRELSGLAHKYGTDHHQEREERPVRRQYHVRMIEASTSPGGGGGVSIATHEFLGRHGLRPNYQPPPPLPLGERRAGRRERAKPSADCPDCFLDCQCGRNNNELSWDPAI